VYEYLSTFCDFVLYIYGQITGGHLRRAQITYVFKLKEFFVCTVLLRMDRDAYFYLLVRQFTATLLRWLRYFGDLITAAVKPTGTEEDKKCADNHAPAVYPVSL
jgi:hypothetical protein